MTEFSANNPVLSPIAIGAKCAAAMFGLSERTWRRLNSEGQCPSPIRVGRSIRWRVADLNWWAQCGCPSRTELERQRSVEPVHE